MAENREIQTRRLQKRSRHFESGDELGRIIPWGRTGDEIIIQSGKTHAPT